MCAIVDLCHKEVVMLQCKMTLGVGEMSEGLRKLAALVDDLSFTPRTPIRWIKTATPTPGDRMASFGLCEHPYTCMYANSLIFSRSITFWLVKAVPPLSNTCTLISSLWKNLWENQSNPIWLILLASLTVSKLCSFHEIMIFILLASIY